MLDFRIEHKVAADIAKGIGKKLGIRFERVRNEVYFTADGNFYKEKSGLNGYNFFSQGIMEYRLLGTTGLTAIGRKIYVDEDYQIKLEGLKYDQDTGRYLVSDEPVGAEFIELVSIKAKYLICSAERGYDYKVIWGKNLGDKPKPPNQKTYRQHQREQEQEQERQERLLALMEGAAAEAVEAFTERQQKAAQRAMEEGVAAAEARRRGE